MKRAIALAGLFWSAPAYACNPDKIIERLNIVLSTGAPAVMELSDCGPPPRSPDDATKMVPVKILPPFCPNPTPGKFETIIRVVGGSFVMYKRPSC